MRSVILALVFAIGFAPPAKPAEETGSRKPGETFSDCAQCPEMVIIPAGSFVMGSPPSEKNRSKSEEPQHRVTISRPFAVSKYEVTFSEWDACVADGGCNGYSPKDRGWGRFNRPVIDVNWNDAKAYVAWLSRKTGKPYRLPSEAEWEYAVRAGTTEANFWGDDPNLACGYANVGDLTAKKKYKNPGDYIFHDCDDDWWATAPVGAYRPNAFGLYDMLGNVWEWMEDCMNVQYTNAPTNGAAWMTGKCNLRILRGGGWNSRYKTHRSAARVWGKPDTRSHSIGFRVAMTLD